LVLHINIEEKNLKSNPYQVLNLGNYNLNAIRIRLNECGLFGGFWNMAAQLRFAEFHLNKPQ